MQPIPTRRTITHSQTPKTKDKMKLEITNCWAIQVGNTREHRPYLMLANRGQLVPELFQSEELAQGYINRKPKYESRHWYAVSVKITRSRKPSKGK